MKGSRQCLSLDKIRTVSRQVSWQEGCNSLLKKLMTNSPKRCITKNIRFRQKKRLRIYTGHQIQNHFLYSQCCITNSLLGIIQPPGGSYSEPTQRDYVQRSPQIYLCRTHPCVTFHSFNGLLLCRHRECDTWHRFEFWELNRFMAFFLHTQVSRAVFAVVAWGVSHAKLPEDGKVTYMNSGFGLYTKWCFMILKVKALSLFQPVMIP